MGLSLSWVGFKQLSRKDILRRMGLKDTGQETNDLDAPLRLVDVPTGWSIVIVRDMNYVSPESLAVLSAGTLVVACQVDENAMFSAAHGFVNTHRSWGVWHEAELGIDHCETFGQPPVGFELIRARLTEEQRREKNRVRMQVLQTPGKPLVERLLKTVGAISLEHGTRDETQVDHMFDIPIEFAASLTGYRYDHRRFEWGLPRFIKLEAAR